MDQFSLVEPVNGFGEGVVVTVAFAAHRRFYASFCETLAVTDRDVLRAPVAVMDQGVAALGLPGI